MEEETIDILKGLLSGRVDSYEIFLSSSQGLVVEAKDGRIDTFKVWSNSGVGLRVIRKNRMGHGFSSVLTSSALEGLVEGVIKGAEGVSEDLSLGFPSVKIQEKLPEGLFDPEVRTTPEERKIEIALQIEAHARGLDKRITRIRKAGYTEKVLTTRLVNSNGVDGVYRASFCTGSVLAVGEEDGDSQMGFEMEQSHSIKDIDPERIGTGAARRALGMLGARRISTVRCPAVLENMVVCDLLGTISRSFLGDNILKGKSMLAGKRGKRVVSSAINLWDDGLLPGGWATSVFDGEGVPRRRTPLVREGVVEGYLYDTYWGRRSGEDSTGNAIRSGYRTFPAVGISNFYIEKGEKDLEGLVEDMGKGLIITEFLGAHTINPVTGEFSLGASGYWVEGGRRVFPVRGVAVSGNLLDLFSGVESVGCDLRFVGPVGAPSLLLGSMEVSGV